MYVEPTQLVPGCVLLNDVKGKSNRAIIPKKTILTEKHITILNKFLITSVDVGSKLADGTVYTPKVVQEKKNQQKDVSMLSFAEHYHYVVQSYKKLFATWQNNIQVDMPTVRKLAIPLFKRIDEGDADVFMLPQYNTKEDYLYHHGVAVSLIAMYLGKKMGYAYGECIQIGLAGFLSDCGMARIADSDEIKKHPTYSFRMVENIPSLTQIVKLAILQHHERIDGSGYPLGVEKDKIHAYSRIIAVSDMYHALTCEQLHQPKQSPFQVMEKLIRAKYTLFDYQVVETFSKGLATAIIGKKVKLSNGQTGKVVFVEDKYPTRPMVQINQSNEILSLRNNGSIYIDELVVV